VWWYAIKQQPILEVSHHGRISSNANTRLLVVIVGLELVLDKMIFVISSIQGVVVNSLLSIAIGLIFVFRFVLHLALLRASSLSARLAALSFCSRLIFLRVALLSFFISSAILGTSSRNAARATAQYSTDPIVIGEFVVALGAVVFLSVMCFRGMAVSRYVRGVGGESSVCGDAVPVDLACAFAVLDAREEQDDVIVLGDGSHCQFCLLCAWLRMFAGGSNKERWDAVTGERKKEKRSDRRVMDCLQRDTRKALEL